MVAHLQRARSAAGKERPQHEGGEQRHDTRRGTQAAKGFAEASPSSSWDGRRGSKESREKRSELAKSELRSEGRASAKWRRFRGDGRSGPVTLILFVALVLALEETLGGLAALVVAAGTLVIGGVAGAIGWAYRVRKLLPRTQRTLKEDAQWAQRLS